MESIDEQIKNLYAARDSLASEVLERIPVGEKVSLGDGRELEHVHAFSKKNVAFGHGAVREYDLKIHRSKKVTIPKAKKVSRRKSEA